MPVPLAIAPYVAAASAAPIATALSAIAGAVGGVLVGKYIFKNYDDWYKRASQISTGIQGMVDAYNTLSDEKKASLQGWVVRLNDLNSRFLTGELLPLAKIFTENAASFSVWSKMDDALSGSERLEPLQELSVALGKELQRVTGISIPGLEEVKRNCDIFCKAGEAMKWGLIIMASYYGGKLLLDWYIHGDTIPRDRLPRYAGGTRRSS